ncbi:hypothetical protein K3000_28810, partial [Pseudomonas aeruginosa]|nr:hypothetical protein [Pseudomonas aeruginosa]
MERFLVVVLLPAHAPPERNGRARAVADGNDIQRLAHAQIKCWNPAYSFFECGAAPGIFRQHPRQ